MVLGRFSLFLTLVSTNFFKDFIKSQNEGEPFFQEMRYVKFSLISLMRVFRFYIKQVIYLQDSSVD